MKFDYDIGVIGGGAAGLTLAAGAARLGAKVLLVDKSKRLGGDCLHYGCVPSKTLLHVAKVYHQSRTMERLGLPTFHGSVDFAKIGEHIQSVIRKIEPHDSPERFMRLGVTVSQCLPEFQDEHTVCLDGRNVTARFWTLTTGSEPAIPDIPGLSDVPFLTNKTIFSLQQLPEHLVVLGAGPVALEMSQAFSRLGSRVSVIQRNDQILSREDADLAHLVQEQLEVEGVRFHLETAVQEIRKTEAQLTLKLVSGGRENALSATHVLVATGRKANVEGLGLERIAVRASDHGVQVDDRLRCNGRNIFAAGDVTGRYQFTHAAAYEAGIVLANTVFRIPRKADYTAMPWCTYTDPELASIGLNEKRAQAAGKNYVVWEEDLTSNDRAITTGEATGKVKLLLDRRERPLGVQICGPQAGEMLGMWAYAFSGKIGLSRLAGAIFPYPTLSEANKRVAGNFVGSKLFSDKVRFALKALFGLQGSAKMDGARF